jgi:hypothetical protein
MVAITGTAAAAVAATASAGSAAASIATGVAAISTVIGGIQAFQQGRAQQDIAKEQSRVAIAKGNMERFQQQQEAERVRKRATAEAGKGGGSLTGSYLENLNQSMVNAQLDEEAITFNAEVSSANFIQEGRNARASGTASLISGIGGAATSLSGLKGSTAKPKGSFTTKPGVKPTFRG